MEIILRQSVENLVVERVAALGVGDTKPGNCLGGPVEDELASRQSFLH